MTHDQAIENAAKATCNHWFVPHAASLELVKGPPCPKCLEATKRHVDAYLAATVVPGFAQTLENWRKEREGRAS